MRGKGYGTLPVRVAAQLTVHALNPRPVMRALDDVIPGWGLPAPPHISRDGNHGGKPQRPEFVHLLHRIAGNIDGEPGGIGPLEFRQVPPDRLFLVGVGEPPSPGIGVHKFPESRDVQTLPVSR